MRVIVHISDLHFGRVDDMLVDPLVRAIDDIRPDVVAVSGDLTQRARRREFEAAALFLARLPFRKVVVPGNHDVPLFNPLARFARPLRGYCKYVTQDLAPFYVDDELAVLGLNTARSLTWKDGRINEEQLGIARSRLCALPPDIIKVLVTHHPFDVVEPGNRADIVGRAHTAMDHLAQCGVDVLLAGHLHESTTVTTAERYCIAGHAALVVQAGTALSERTRKEANAFNVIRTAPGRVTVQRRLWDDAAREFVDAGTAQFRAVGEVWQPDQRLAPGA